MPRHSPEIERILENLQLAYSLLMHLEVSPVRFACGVPLSDLADAVDHTAAALYSLGAEPKGGD